MSTLEKLQSAHTCAYCFFPNILKTLIVTKIILFTKVKNVSVECSSYQWYSLQLRQLTDIKHKHCLIYQYSTPLFT